MENEIYKNAPLVEAVFEIRFSTELSIECNRDKFYGKIRNTYSKIVIPDPMIPLTPYKFEREDGTCGVMLSVNRLGYFCKKYEGFKIFKNEVLRIFSIFSKLFKVNKITRTGLRYINILPFTREKDLIPIKNYLNVNIDLPKSIPTDFKHLTILFISKIEGGAITTRIEPMITADNTKEAIILDFDFAKEDSLNFNSISKYLDDSHTHTKNLFEKLITDDYRKIMRGEVI